MESRRGAAFTSSKCPPGPNQSCALPFGFVWTPLQNDEETANDVVVVNHMPPILCLTCLSYLNLYAHIDDENQKWTCPLCESVNVLPPNVPPELLASPDVEFRQDIVTTPATRDVDSTTVVLALDANLPPEEAKAVGNMLQSVLFDTMNSNKENIVLHVGLLIFGKTVSIYQLGTSGIAYADVLCAHPSSSSENDTDDEENSLSTKKPYLKRIESAEDLECIWLCLSAFYGIPMPTKEELLQPNNKSSKESFDLAASQPTSRLEMLRKRKEARMRAEQTNAQTDVPLSPWSHQDTPLAQRCTGEAMQCAVDLASMLHVDPPPRTSRIFLFTNGCPNFGPGSVVATEGGHRAPYAVDSFQLARSKDYFDLLAKTAAEGGVGIDVLCTGASELGMPAYQALVEPSSGYVLSHDSFVTPHLTQNMNFIWNGTYMSGMYAEETEDHNWIDGCFMDLRMVGFVEPTHLVGTGEFVENTEGSSRLLPNEQSAFSEGTKLALEAGIPGEDFANETIIDNSMTRIRLGRYDPLSTFSVMLQLHDVLPDDEYAIFQCTARFVSKDGKTLITKLSTHRLAVAKDVSEFVDSVDENVVPVLLGKEAVYRSMYGREVDGNTIDAVDHAELEKLAYDAQTDIDTTIQHISGAFRLLGLEEGARALDLTEDGQTRATGTSMDFAFPPELTGALRRMYHLRRGPFISPGPLQSIDDRAEKRSLFVRFPLEHCLSMMAPALWSSGQISSEQQRVEVSLSESVPPETMVLWRNRVLAGDHFDSLFVWSGAETRGVAYDEVRRQFRELLLHASIGRFPTPKLHVVSEKDSMSRRFTSLLSPSHADPPQHQVAHFPALEELSEDEISHLRSKHRFHDPDVDPSFRQWFWGVSSAANKRTGVSLCE